jgi:hypothetical protein
LYERVCATSKAWWTDPDMLLDPEIRRLKMRRPSCVWRRGMLSCHNKDRTQSIRTSYFIAHALSVKCDLIVEASVAVDIVTRSWCEDGVVGRPMGCMAGATRSRLRPHLIHLASYTYTLFTTFGTRRRLMGTRNGTTVTLDWRRARSSKCA